MAAAPHVFILTGAGISADSGVPTFRDADGLWEGHRVEDVATPAAFRRDPALVQQFYNLRRRALDRVAPNPAHFALAALEALLDRGGGRMTLVTQNVDDLHERAGSRRFLAMHGSLRQAKCTRCDWHGPATGDLTLETRCLACGVPGQIRPDIVWFHETPYFMDEIAAALASADLFAAIGTSGNVYPAAGFAAEARALGVATMELNLVPSRLGGPFDSGRYGRAAEIVPAWVADFRREYGLQ